VAVDAIDPFNRLARQSEQGEPDRHTDLADDPDAAVVELGQQVVGLADAAPERAFDGDDATIGRTVRDGLEDRPPCRHGGALGGVGTVAEEGEDRLLGERAGLALIGHGCGCHGRSVADPVLTVRSPGDRTRGGRCAGARWAQVLVTGCPKRDLSDASSDRSVAGRPRDMISPGMGRPTHERAKEGMNELAAIRIRSRGARNGTGARLPPSVRSPGAQKTPARTLSG